ncbi:MAG: signal peptide peptidase SppA [Pelagibacteraceae bacterium]|nr:signal peptide peptidase SppA [Pelagibacteraceae bacterium]PPR10849.1 MAG: putative signal peptide peptidase SppA [Alphaproteobacteria bacterium MarineAlpha11_Bin1]|tara:strand:- start:45059 stop:45973 length:915 start_codon:yes stop_codon:yes gene_type:complete
MPLDSDNIIDRLRLKRRLTFWRIAAIFAVVVAIVAIYGRVGGSLGNDDFIARVEVKGIIVQDDERILKIRKLAQNDSVKAVIVRIDSPGGTVVGGETLHNALLALGEEKPLVAVMGGLATSAAYMAAIATDRLFARKGTLTGSIGVILQTTEITKLLGMMGVSARSFKSGSLKAMPSPFEPVTGEVEATTQALVADMYGMFRDMVIRRRNMQKADAEKFSDGRVFTGQQALRAGLVDQIGGEEDARAWLVERKNLSPDLKIRTVPIQPDAGSLFLQLISLARKTILYERLTLDGLISLWQPQAM